MEPRSAAPAHPYPGEACRPVRRSSRTPGAEPCFSLAEQNSAEVDLGGLWGRKSNRPQANPSSEIIPVS